jgi:hypothetical protein
MKIKLKYFYLSYVFAISPALLSNISYAKDENKIIECGKAQLDANHCLNESDEATNGMFNGLASKITKSDLGKTGANQASSQTANLLCKDKIEKANKVCDLKERK